MARSRKPAPLLGSYFWHLACNVDSMKLITYILLLIACGSFIAGKPTNYQYKAGRILLPDYANSDTLIITKNFNMPAGLASDSEIMNFLKDKTIKK